MKREILRGLTMLMLVVAVAFMTAVTSANGQVRSLAAEIPFAFNVGDRALPAGKYMVRNASENGNALMIQNRNAGKAAIRLTHSIEASKASENAKLVFHRYGKNYFLAEVWSAGERTGRRLLKSKQERTIEGQLAGVFSKSELARNSYEIVEIVATVH